MGQSPCSEQLIEEIGLYVKSQGANLSAQDSWLMLRSLKTLGLRVEKQAANALQIAQWLKQQPEVTDVYYAGLPEHPGFQLNRQQASGSGAMISFKVKDSTLARSILGKVKLIAFAESLGGVESLITYPLYQTHECMPKYLLECTGLDDRLLRLSVGNLGKGAKEPCGCFSSHKLTCRVYKKFHIKCI